MSKFAILCYYFSRAEFDKIELSEDDQPGPPKGKGKKANKRNVKNRLNPFSSYRTQTLYIAFYMLLYSTLSIQHLTQYKKVYHRKFVILSSPTWHGNKNEIFRDWGSISCGRQNFQRIFKLIAFLLILGFSADDKEQKQTKEQEGTKLNPRKIR